MPPSPWKKAHERRRERAVKREAVLLAAARAFTERGFHNTSLDEIATRLNVTKPTIYYYFTNKEDLLSECYRVGLQRLDAALQEIEGSERNGLEKLLVLMRRYAEVITADYGKVMVRVQDYELSPAGRRKVKRLKGEIDRRIRTLIEEGTRDGSISARDPKMVAFALGGSLNWIGQWFDESGPLTAGEVAERFLELFVRGLRPR